MRVLHISSVQFSRSVSLKTYIIQILCVCVLIYMLSLVAHLYPVLCDPIDQNTPGFPVHHQLSELAQTHVH